MVYHDGERLTTRTQHHESLPLMFDELPLLLELSLFELPLATDGAEAASVSEGGGAEGPPELLAGAAAAAAPSP